MRQELEHRLKIAEKELSTLRDRFEATIHRWLYSTEEIWSYRDQRFFHTDDTVLPDAPGAFCACGFDLDDKPIYQKHFEIQTTFERTASGGNAMRRIPTTKVWVEEFFEHFGDTLKVTRTMHGKVTGVYELRFKNRLLAEQIMIQDGFFHHTLYTYEGRRTTLQQDLSDTGRLIFETKFGPNGEQSYYRIRRDGTRFQLYQPWPKGVTLKSVKDIIRRRLLALVPQVVADAGLKEPIYCVTLGYDGEGNDPLPPTIAIGSETEREQWLTRHGKEARDFVWNPAEFLHYEKPYTQLEDEELEEACDLLNSKLAEGDSISPAVKLLIEVAKELNSQLWPETIQRTSDFIVYAVDYELGDIRKNLKACVPPDRLAKLRARDLI